MRLVQKTDADGRNHLIWVKDIDPDTAIGINADPPPIDDLDWEAIKRDLHNGLVNNKLMQLSDLQRSDSGLNTIIMMAFKRRLVDLYRSVENG